MARCKGQGSIKQRSNGLYVGTIKKNGITRQVSSMSRHEVEMKLYALSLKEDFSVSDSVLFQQYVYDYLYTYKYKHIKDTSFDRLESIYRNHIAGSALGKTRMEALTDIIVQQHINVKSADASLSQAKKIYELIRAVLYYAYRKGDIDRDIGALVLLPKKSMFPEPKHIETYEWKEIDRITEVILSMYEDSYNMKRLLRTAPALLIMFNTGLRAGEMLALTWKDIDMVNRMIHVHSTVVRTRNENGKGFQSYISSTKTFASVRDVPINEAAFNAFNLLYKRTAEFDCLCDYAVCNLKGSFMTLQGLQENMKRICEICHVPYKGLHAIRHTFASSLIDKGTSPKTVSEILGHTSVAFTLNRYVHPDMEVKVEALKNL